MAISISGTNGISGVDGTATAPAFTGADADTGIFFGTDTATISTAGSARLACDASGNVEISTFKVDSSGKVGINETPTTDLDVNGNYAGNVTAITVDSNTLVADIDCSAGNYFTCTVSAATTFTISNCPASRSYSFTLEITHASGSITWPTTVKFPGDSAPSLTTGKTHIFVFITDDGGTRWRSNALVDFTN
tara:strand:+ start:318 stop:893 length:576 start_codon:yes stop_codon:yes gene_type:complete